MVCPSDIRTRATLEKIYRRSPSISVHQLMLDFLRQVGHAVVEVLTRDRSEPHISRFYTIDGKLLWSAYDPVTQKTLVTHSENELRAWLEGRYQ